MAVFQHSDCICYCIIERFREQSAFVVSSSQQVTAAASIYDTGFQAVIMLCAITTRYY